MRATQLGMEPAEKEQGSKQNFEPCFHVTWVARIHGP
jgi:hypothetical protein